jgi:hypothetical protein
MILKEISYQGFPSIPTKRANHLKFQDYCSIYIYIHWTMLMIPYLACQLSTDIICIVLCALSNNFTILTGLQMLYTTTHLSMRTNVFLHGRVDAILNMTLCM